MKVPHCKLSKAVEETTRRNLILQNEYLLLFSQIKETKRPNIDRITEKPERKSTENFSFTFTLLIFFTKCFN